MATRDSKGRFLKGVKSHNAGTATYHLCEYCKKEFRYWESKKQRFCSHICQGKSKEVTDKISKSNTGNPNHKHWLGKIREDMRGVNNSCWKGGTGTIRHQDMGKLEYKEWRSKVFERDNYTCQKCGIKDAYLHADHIIEWTESEELRYNLANGTTLCFECHYKKTFPNKPYIKENAIKWGIPLKYRKEVVF
jgi:hypothetical protein